MSEMITTYFSNIANGVKSFITGLSLTFEHMKNKKDNVATLQYPHEKFPIPEKKIGFEQSEYNVIRSRLHVDIDDCISCRMCERACPVDCIKIEDVKAKKGVDFDYGTTSNETKKKLLVSRFTIDMSECMYCNLCVYPCPEECIYMVGGPNEEKHEIDYEFSQYKREGMIFEFAKASTDDLMEIGAEDYLKKVKEKQEKITKGERLLGLEVEKVVTTETVTPPPTAPITTVEAAAPAVAVDNLTIKCVDVIEDIKLRASAKKVFFKSKKAGDDDAVKIDKILAEIKTLDGFSADIEQKLVALKPAPAAAPAASPAASAPEVAPAVAVDNLTIKCVDVIEDIKLRASAKKVFFKSKKAGDDDAVKIDKILAEIKTLDGFSADIEQKLVALKPAPAAAPAASPAASAPETTVPVAEIKKELFSMKELNDIKDIKIRAGLKKIYMTSKKEGLSNDVAINNMLSHLENENQMNDKIKEKLENLK